MRARTVCYIETSAYEYRLHEASTTGNVADDRLVYRARSYFTVIEQLRALNRRIGTRPDTKKLLRGEVVGRARHLFELTKQMSSNGAREEVLAACHKQRFAEELWPDAINFKRKRQVLSMQFRQWINRKPKA